MAGKMGNVRGTCVECCWVERMVETGVQHTCGEGDRCVRCLCMPQGGGALSAWGREGFVTVCGGCGDGGGRERIWS